MQHLFVVRSMKYNLKTSERQLRVAFLAGTLAQGGAEKQMAYMIEALRRAGAAVEVLTLVQGGFYDAWLRDRGVFARWVGRCSNPAIRLAALAHVLGKHRPHLIQAGHTYMNAYAAILGRMGYGISIGAVRTNVTYLAELHNKFVARLLMSTTALITNSEETRYGLIANGFARAERIHVVPNAVQGSGSIKLQRGCKNRSDRNIRALFLARLIPQKRVDRFLRALALARHTGPHLTGVIAGAGPERENAERLARVLGLSDSEAAFIGHSEDVQELLASVDLLVFTSDDIEGSPNSILEAMAHGVPVVTTPCGNAPSLVENGKTGYVCGFDVHSVAEKMVRLAHSPELRTAMGEAARRRAAERYGTDVLAERLIKVYRAAASACHNHGVTELLEHA
jgi:glycosyltransferase involved in cell wall biosynthesis